MAICSLNKVFDIGDAFRSKFKVQSDAPAARRMAPVQGSIVQSSMSHLTVEYFEPPKERFMH
jgi:hypothetical protein